MPDEAQSGLLNWDMKLVSERREEGAERAGKVRIRSRQWRVAEAQVRMFWLEVPQRA